MLKGVNWIAVAVAFVLIELLGYVWYTFLFGAAWAAALPAPPDMSNPGMTYGMGAVLTILTVLGLSWLLRKAGGSGLQANLGAALAAFVFFDVPAQAMEFVYMGISSTVVGINMGFQLVCYLLAAAVLTLLPAKAEAA